MRSRQTSVSMTCGALPTPGGPDDFPRLVQQFARGDTSDNPSRSARTLFAIRWKLGALLGWDDPDSGLGSRVPTLRDDRLPRLCGKAYMAAIAPFRHMIV